MASVSLPGWKPQERKEPKKDPLDTIQQGLAIAASAYGIYADYQKLDLAKQTQMKAQESQASEDALKQAQAEYYRSKAGEKPEKPETVKATFTTDLVNPKTGKREGAFVQPGQEPRFTGAEVFEKQTREKSEIDQVKRFDMANTIQKEFEGRIAEPKGRYEAATRVDQLLSLKNPIGDAAAKYQFLKVSGNVGATSDKEMEMVGGSRDLKSRAIRAFDKAYNGIELTDQDRKDMRDATNVMKSLSQKDIMEQAKRFAKQKAGISPFTENEIYNDMIRPGEIFSQIQDAIASAGTIQQQPTILPFSPSLPGAAGTTPGTIRQQRGLMQRLGGEAQAAPNPTATGFSPDDYLRSP